MNRDPSPATAEALNAELLALLEEAVRRENTSMNQQLRTPAMRVWLDKAKAAIAKARGNA
jgi:hypothetical protein